MIIRYLFIENYYGTKHEGINARDMYIRMQDFRKHQGYGNIAVEKFLTLIGIFEKQGYNAAYPVETDKNLLIRDGSHRTALAVYFNTKFVTVNPVNTPFPFSRKLELFENNGFSEVEKQYISDKYQDILNRLNVPFKILIQNGSSEELSKTHNILQQYGNVIKTEVCSIPDSRVKKFNKQLNQLDDGSFSKFSSNGFNEFTVFYILHKNPELETVTDTRKPVVKQNRYITDSIKSLCSESKLQTGFFVPCNFGINIKLEEILAEYSALKYTHQ